jgi:general stress protein CsbA
MKLIILLFSSIVLGFLLSVFLIKQYNIDVPPIFTGGLITAIGYFTFKNKIEEDEN